jgi:serine/threonine protein kinase
MRGVQVATDADPVPAIGRYILRARLASGITGYVYEAEDRAMDRIVAVKVLASDFEDEPETRERFYREARITAQLSHPNIVRVLDVGEDQGRPFIAMERLEGLPLDAYLRAQPALPLADRLALIVQMYAGLAAAHGQGAVHRDIKPGNVFVQRDGAVKILDFGLARLRSSTLTASGLVVGSPGYMSPEQAEGRQVDERSDIFSAGAVSYLILTGRPPFDASSLPAALDAILTRSPHPLTEAEAPGPLTGILQKALEKSPDDRYQTCAEVLADLRRVEESVVRP